MSDQISMLLPDVFMLYFVDCQECETTVLCYREEARVGWRKGKDFLVQAGVKETGFESHREHANSTTTDYLQSNYNVENLPSGQRL